MINNLTNKAMTFAKAAHDSINHKRKYTNEPYWIHPERVAKIVASVCTDQAVIAAAWLHDVLEDVAPKNRDYDEAAIKETFGEKVLTLVLEVTDVSTLSDGNRATRKAIEREHLAAASANGKLIKLADLIDNVEDLSKNDPNFANVFKKEVRLDLPYLQSVNDELYLRLKKLLKR